MIGESSRLWGSVCFGELGGGKKCRGDARVSFFDPTQFGSAQCTQLTTQHMCLKAYLDRLLKTAMSLDKSFVESAIRSMKSRCEKLYLAKGGHFEEGGR